MSFSRIFNEFRIRQKDFRDFHETVIFPSKKDWFRSVIFLSPMKIFEVRAVKQNRCNLYHVGAQ